MYTMYNVWQKHIFFFCATASEPNLKGRNQLKHRTNRYKPHIDHHPLNPRHYSPNDTSSSTTTSRHREAISPTTASAYRPPLEKVFHPGPRGVPLFQSPSLPNININSSRSKVHFPSSSSSVSGVSFINRIALNTHFFYYQKMFF